MLRFSVPSFRTGVLGITVVVILVLSVCVWQGTGPAVEPQPPSRSAAIAALERKGGLVGIDGEQPGEPVWMVDLTEVDVDAQTLALVRAFPALEKLVLDRTPVDDRMLEPISQLTTLKELSLADTRITDAGLKRLLPLRSLVQLNISGTSVTNEGLLTLAPLSRLSDILYAESRVTDAGMQRFTMAQQRAKPSGDEPESPASVPPVDDPSGPASPLEAAQTELAGTLHELGRALFPGALGSSERTRQAVALLEQAVRIEPENEQYRLDLADAYLEQGTDESLTLALSLYESVLAERPGDDALLSRMAEAYGGLGNFDAAIALAVVRGRQADKTAFPAALQIAALAAEGGEIARGIAELKALVDLHPDDAGIRLLLAALLLESGNRAEASAAVQAASAKLDSNHPLMRMAKRLREKCRS